jgi:hypothetical protein
MDKIRNEYYTRVLHEVNTGGRNQILLMNTSLA